MRACCDRGISRVVRGSGLTGAATSELRTRAGDELASTRGFRADRSPEGAPSEIDGSTGCCFGVKSASAAWRALVIRSRSSPRGWCCCSRWLSKGRPDCLATQELRRQSKRGHSRKLSPHSASEICTEKPECDQRLGCDPNILISARLRAPSLRVGQLPTLAASAVTFTGTFEYMSMQGGPVDLLAIGHRVKGPLFCPHRDRQRKLTSA